ncbi:acyl-CoA dehydrogenase family protein [Sorangium atrum]|uniref:Acyl-CoA dehydrogenase family protein n=1 Tax=Sorangium atrum TaxID=2995308 RepID=A0ABT5C2P5_9BACT|nr:acyl-CoA dehydrogenase family protein [Sorangium aterium]MDC0680675.1 acyl-CoA dehydrogenase family protein [Sorangium aterium]
MATMSSASSAAPASLLDAARSLVPLVQEHPQRGERERRLPDPVARALRESGIFRMCRPRALGGLEVDPLTALQVIEELSRADGAAGWCAMICGTTGAFEAYIPAEGGKEMHASPDAVTAGVFAPSGRAVEVEGGYRVAGRWAMASACHHCDWLGGTAVVYDGSAPRMLPGGVPEAIVPMFRASECEILDTWSVSGLAGTGSHDFAVVDVFVPSSRCIRLPMTAPTHPGPLFVFPLFGFLASAVAATALGMARAAVDELTRLAATKRPSGMTTSLATRPSTALAVAEAEATLGAARAYLLEAVGAVWDAAVSGSSISLRERARVRLAATNAALGAARAVDLAFTAGGATALYAESPLQRSFRDVHAVTQHALVAPHTREVQGRVLLGLDTELPMF